MPSFKILRFQLMIFFFQHQNAEEHGKKDDKEGKKKGRDVS